MITTNAQQTTVNSNISIYSAAGGLTALILFNPQLFKDALGAVSPCLGEGLEWAKNHTIEFFSPTETPSFAPRLFNPAIGPSPFMQMVHSGLSLLTADSELFSRPVTYGALAGCAVAAAAVGYAASRYRSHR